MIKITGKIFKSMSHLKSSQWKYANILGIWYLCFVQYQLKVCKYKLSCLTDWQDSQIRKADKVNIVKYNLVSGTTRYIVWMGLCKAETTTPRFLSDHSLTAKKWLNFNLETLPCVQTIQKKGRLSLAFYSICGFWGCMHWAFHLHIQLKLGTWAVFLCEFLFWRNLHKNFCSILGWTQNNFSHLPVFFLCCLLPIHTFTAQLLCGAGFHWKRLRSCCFLSLCSCMPECTNQS